MNTLLRRLYVGLVQAPDPFLFDPRLDRLVEDLCRAASPRCPVLNLGSGTTRLGSGVINLDLRPFPGVHLCGNGESLPFADGRLSGVLLRGVFEHVRDADRVRAEVERVLPVGGFVYVEVPFLQAFHASPEDYRRFTLHGLRAFLGRFTEVEAGVQIGPWSSVAWSLREALASLFSLGFSSLYPKALSAAGWCTFWLKYIDLLVPFRPHVANAASAVYFLGRKRG